MNEGQVQLFNEDELHEVERYLVDLYKNGTPPDEIMKKALDRVSETTRNNPLTSECNILILNLNDRGKCKMSLNDLLYHRTFERDIWPWRLRYGIWVFRDGDVDHSACTGGWVNWSMYGRFERSGGPGSPIVKFFRPG